jgi:hypothetical protein
MTLHRAAVRPSCKGCSYYLLHSGSSRRQHMLGMRSIVFCDGGALGALSCFLHPSFGRRCQIWTSERDDITPRGLEKPQRDSYFGGSARVCLPQPPGPVRWPFVFPWAANNVIIRRLHVVSDLTRCVRNAEISGSSGRKDLDRKHHPGVRARFRPKHARNSAR